MEPGPSFDDRLHTWTAALEQSRVLQNRGALLRARLLGSGGQLRFRDGFTMPVHRSNLQLAINLVRLSYFGATLSTTAEPKWRGWSVSFETGTIQTPEGIRFCLDSIEPAIFAETYIHQIHFFGFDLGKQIVVDVGGFVGDTALYFAHHGAKVIVYEPDPSNYSMLQRNLALNPSLAERVTAWNKAVGFQGSMPVGVGLQGGSGSYVASPRLEQVPSVDLAGLLEENHLARADILKLDAKGTEFSMLAEPALSQFDFLSCEYSADLVHKSPELLIKAVNRAGFSRVRVFKHNCFYYRLQEHGTIQASKAASPGPDC